MKNFYSELELPTIVFYTSYYFYTTTIINQRYFYMTTVTEDNNSLRLPETSLCCNNYLKNKTTFRVICF